MMVPQPMDWNGLHLTDSQARPGHRITACNDSGSRGAGLVTRRSLHPPTGIGAQEA